MYTFRGSPFERGRQHGEMRATAIRTRVASSVRAVVGDDIVGARLEVLAAPWWRSIVDAAPNLADELRGISSGSSVSLPEIVLLNAFEAFALPEQVELGGCTTIALPGSEGAIVGQNWDANPALAATVEAHRHLDPEGMDVLLLSSPGGLGWIGMNAAGLAITTNDLLTPGTAEGVPSQVVRRLVLEQVDVPSALDVLLRMPVVGGRTYGLGDAFGRVAIAELSTEAGLPQITILETPGAHANHALEPEVARWESAEQLAAIYPSSHARQARAMSVIGSDEPASAAAVGGILADHVGFPSSICRHETPGEPTVTAAAAVFDCAGRTAHVAFGNPCTGAFVAIALS